MCSGLRFGSRVQSFAGVERWPFPRARRIAFLAFIADFSLAALPQEALIAVKSYDFQFIGNTTTNIYMAKALSKSQIAATLAEKHDLSKKDAVQILDTLAAMAYKQAKNTFTIPGLGKLVLVNRKARVGRNPATGEQINIPAKRVVKFRVAKAAKDAILGTK